MVIIVQNSLFCGEGGTKTALQTDYQIGHFLKVLGKKNLLKKVAQILGDLGLLLKNITFK